MEYYLAMTEVFQNTSQQLTDEIYGLQEIINRRLRNLKTEFTDLTIPQQAEFCDKAQREVNFELSLNELIFPSMALVIEIDRQHTSGFITQPIGGNDKASLQKMTDGDILHGFLDAQADVQPISRLATVLEGSSASMRDSQLSVLLNLSGVVFERGDKTYQLDEQYYTYIPLSYGGFIFEEADLTVIE